MAGVSDLLKPYNARLMRCYLVSNRLNSVVNDDAECCAPVELEQIQGLLSVVTLNPNLSTHSACFR